VAFIVDGKIKLVDTPRNLRIRAGERRVLVEYRGDGGTEKQEFPLDGLGNNPEFLELLRTRPVETIHTMEATLESVFIQVTGRSLT
jgi:fluoroquinolone transport system ATP-binding protein